MARRAGRVTGPWRGETRAVGRAMSRALGPARGVARRARAEAHAIEDTLAAGSDVSVTRGTLWLAAHERGIGSEPYDVVGGQ